VLVGMTPVGERAGFEVYPFVDGARRIIGSNYGSAEPAIDFPRYAAWSIEGRLPVERLIDRRIALDDVEDAFAAMREGRFIRQVISFES
jgi:Zn-dependent alcohol dehydrogenase